MKLLLETSEASRQAGICPWFHFPYSALTEKSPTLRIIESLNKAKQELSTAIQNVGSVYFGCTSREVITHVKKK